MQAFLPEKGVTYDCVWYQFCAMYLSDQEWIDSLRTVRSCLKSRGKIFVKENMTIVKDQRTKVLPHKRSDGKRDLSLVRCRACFDYIFGSAQLKLESVEEWNPTDDDGIAVYTAVYVAGEKIKVGSHKGCEGAECPMVW